MQSLNIKHTDRQRWLALSRINTLSALSQIVQIGTIDILRLSQAQFGDQARQRYQTLILAALRCRANHRCN
jgi:hypothetical protein